MLSIHSGPPGLSATSMTVSGPLQSCSSWHAAIDLGSAEWTGASCDRESDTGYDRPSLPLIPTSDPRRPERRSSRSVTALEQPQTVVDAVEWHRDVTTGVSVPVGQARNEIAKLRARAERCAEDPAVLLIDLANADRRGCRRRSRRRSPCGRTARALDDRHASRAPPTQSSATSAPRPPVNLRTRAPMSPMSQQDNPHPRRSARRDELPVGADDGDDAAPRQPPDPIAAVPTPPDAPVTSTSRQAASAQR